MNALKNFDQATQQKKRGEASHIIMDIRIIIAVICIVKASLPLQSLDAS
jgi:hypothetical protein